MYICMYIYTHTFMYNDVYILLCIYRTLPQHILATRAYTHRCAGADWRKLVRTCAVARVRAIPMQRGRGRGRGIERGRQREEGGERDSEAEVEREGEIE